MSWYMIGKVSSSFFVNFLILELYVFSTVLGSQKNGRKGADISHILPSPAPTNV